MGLKKRTGGAGRAIAALAGRQHGVVSRGQLRALGLSDTQIAARAASGYLHPIFHATFAVGHGAIGRRGRMLAAVLACGDGTVLSHASAAELLGLWDKQAALVDVIPPSWSGRKIQGIRWHRVLLPTPEEIEVRAGIPCTTVSRTLVDMAGRSSRASMRRLVEQAAVLRRLDVAAVDRILARGRRRGAPRLRATLEAWRSRDERGPLLRSPLEARLLRILTEAGVPAPQCNVKMRVGGEPVEIDMLWPAQRLAVEADGEQTHDTRAAFERDRRRDQLLSAAGYRTFRVTWAQLDHERDALVGRIRRLLSPT